MNAHFLSFSFKQAFIHPVGYILHVLSLNSQEMGFLMTCWIMPISRFPAVGNHRISRNRHSLSNCLFLDSWTCFLRESRIGQALQTISSSIRGVERKGRVKSYGGSIFSLSFPEPPVSYSQIIREFPFPCPLSHEKTWPVEQGRRRVKTHARTGLR